MTLYLPYIALIALWLMSSRIKHYWFKHKHSKWTKHNPVSQMNIEMRRLKAHTLPHTPEGLSVRKLNSMWNSVTNRLDHADKLEREVLGVNRTD